jgi:hypothetical protein
MFKSDSVLVVLVFFATPIFSKQTFQKKEVSEMIKEATNLKAGKFKKSLIKSRIALKFCNRNQRRQRHSCCYNTIAATFELSEPDKAFFYYQKDMYNRTNNDKLKNWLTTT